VHIISCWEIAMLSEKRRIVFNMDVSAWIDLALRHPKITLLPFEPQTAVLAARLENFHGDPADRFLAATCLIYNIPLVTRDRLIHNWQRIRTIW
jgi:PIN domain nuclease of toxin-antitoxin system